MKSTTTKLALAGIVAFVLSMGFAATSFAAERSTSRSHQTKKGKKAKGSQYEHSHRGKSDCGNNKRGRGHSKRRKHERKHDHRHGHYVKPTPKPSKPVLVKRTIYKSGQAPVVTYTKATPKRDRTRDRRR